MDANLTGVQRYTQTILSNFPKNEYDTIRPPLKYSHGMKGHLWEQVILPLKLHNNLLWSPSNSGPINYKKQVVTIHDLVSLDHPEWFNKKYLQWYNYMLPRLCKNVEHIIAISEFTRQRILETFKVPESKVTVVYNGTDMKPPTDNNPHQKLDIPFERYILSLGSLIPRKNVPLLLTAWNNILHKVPHDVGLVVAGDKVSDKIFKDSGINELPPRVYFTGYVDEKYIVQLYSNALFMAYLSAYEGFGLPPLEAMAVGTPVLTSNKTSLPEVVGDGGLLVDIASLAECESGLLELIHNDQLRHDLSQKALIQAKKFNWENTALQTWKVLQHFS